MSDNGFKVWKTEWQKTQDNGYTQQNIWDSAYAAGLEAGLEKAAGIADKERSEFPCDQYESGCDSTATSIAAAIREEIKKP